MQDDAAYEIVGHLVAKPAQVPGIRSIDGRPRLDLNRYQPSVRRLSDDINLYAATIAEMMQRDGAAMPRRLAVHLIGAWCISP